ncbi:MAG: hypothetical protein JWR22_1498 [Herminiimonas sp.]|nr:hypothetical protein [Herminiimonas sp.]
MVAAPSAGITMLATNGKPNEPAWVKQKGQCSKCVAGEWEAGECEAGACSAARCVLGVGMPSTSGLAADVRSMSMPSMSMPCMCDAWGATSAGRGAEIPDQDASQTGLSSREPAATSACEIDGAREASRTAKQAIHAAIRRWRRVNPTMMSTIRPRLEPLCLTILAPTDVGILMQVLPGEFSAVAGCDWCSCCTWCACLTLLSSPAFCKLLFVRLRFRLALRDSCQARREPGGAARYELGSMALLEHASDQPA